MIHCSDNAADRKIGAQWELNYQQIMVERGYLVTMHQVDRNGAAIAVCRVKSDVKRFLLPDASVWDAPGFDSELKHKDPTNAGKFGLEDYRLRSLYAFAKRTKRRVHYTIHNYALCPGATRAERKAYDGNHIEHWITADIMTLWDNRNEMRVGPSWVNGERRIVNLQYWPVEMWTPLGDFLDHYAEAA